MMAGPDAVKTVGTSRHGGEIKWRLAWTSLGLRDDAAVLSEDGTMGYHNLRYLIPGLEAQGSHSGVRPTSMTGGVHVLRYQP